MDKKRDEKEKKERRVKKDWITQMATILSFAAWVIMFFVWIVLYMAETNQGVMFFNSFFDVEPTRVRWDYTLVYIAFVMMLVSLGTCIIAFVCNKMRMKRKSDKYKISIFIIGGITIIALTVFMIYFGYILF